jgi:hypothetical protein
MQPKVFVLLTGTYDQTDVVKVFATRELARAAILDIYNNFKGQIRIFDLDNLQLSGDDWSYHVEEVEFISDGVDYVK